MPLDLIGTFQDIVSVVIAGVSYEGWTEVDIKREINAAAGQFQVGLTEVVAAGSVIPQFSRAAQPDTPVEIYVNGLLALRGNIDTRHGEKDANHHKITVAGRSSSRNCVDCSHVDPEKAAQYNNLKPSQIGKKVTDALGLELETRVTDEQPIEWFRYDPGTTSLNVMHNAALKQGLTIGHTKEGKVLLADTFPDAAPAALIAGGNILKWSVKKSAHERYSKYNARGQKAPNSKYRGKQANQMSAQADDSGLQTYRPKLVVGLGDVDRAELEKRVKHEAARRAGLALNVEVTVVGWTAGGQLWEPGQNAYVQIPDEDIYESLLIKSVYMSKDDEGGGKGGGGKGGGGGGGKGGTITKMNLTKREAFEKGQTTGGTPGAGGTEGGFGFPTIGGGPGGL